MSIANPKPQNITTLRPVKGGAWLSDRDTLRQIGGTLGASALGVYVALETYANTKGECWPSETMLADDTKLTVRQVRRHLRALKEAGWISSKPRFNKYGYQSGVLYTLHHHPSVSEKAHNDGADITPDITPDIPPDKGEDTTPDYPGVENVRQSTRSTGSERSNGGTIARESEHRQTGPTAVPESFTITPALNEWGASEGFTETQMRSQIPRFVDHYTAKGDRLNDWEASFRSWMRRAKEWGHVKKQDYPSHLDESYSTSTPWHLRNIERPDLIGPARMEWERERHRQRTAEQQGAQHAGS